MANQVLTKSQTPTLDWANVSGALEYHAQVSADPRFVTITQQRAGLATSQYALASNLTDGKKYYWRFRTRTSATYTADQTVSTASAAGNNLRDLAANTGLGQSFKPDYSYPIARVTLSLKRVGGAPTNNVWVEIWSDSGGAPSAQIDSDSATVLMSAIGTSAFETVTFNFAIPIPVAAGTTYHIVVQGDWAIDGANYLIWETTGSNSYADGSPFKQSSAPAWSANGTSDHLFVTYYQPWGQWSSVWSFWLDTTAEVAVTPSTKWMLVDVDETTDTYSFTITPKLMVKEPMLPRSYERNLAGDVLQEFITQRDVLTLDFGDAYVHFTQMDEIMRFFHKRRAVYLIALTDNEVDVRERIWKVTFPAEPEFAQLSGGREDYYRGAVELEEAALT